MNKSPLYLLVAILLGAIAIVGVTSQTSTLPDQSVTLDSSRSGEVAGVFQALVTIAVDEGNGNAYQYDQIINEKSTALDVLQFAMQRNFITVQTKAFDFGTLIESINGIKNGQDDKYWVYFIDGESPTVAADQYILESGDLVEFKFMESIF